MTRRPGFLQPVRPQARIDGGRRRFRGCLRAVRHCAIAGPDRGFPIAAGFFGAALVPLSQSILIDIYSPEDAVRDGAVRCVGDGRTGAGPVIGAG